jgi:hypothetical protein
MIRTGVTDSIKFITLHHATFCSNVQAISDTADDILTSSSTEAATGCWAPKLNWSHELKCARTILNLI